MGGKDQVHSLNAQSLKRRTRASIYPESFASRMAGRVKRVLGDRFDIAAFEANPVTLAPGAVSALFDRHRVGRLRLRDQLRRASCSPTWPNSRVSGPDSSRK